MQKYITEQYEKYLPLANRREGRTGGILARGRGSTDLAQRGPYKN